MKKKHFLLKTVEYSGWHFKIYYFWFVKTWQITSTTPTPTARTSHTKLQAAIVDVHKHLGSTWHGADTELTWHDGVSDVEVIERQPQGLTRGGRGCARGLRGWPGRLDGRRCWCGVPAGLEAIVLRFQSLNLILFNNKRIKIRHNLTETAFKTLVTPSNTHTPEADGHFPAFRLAAVVILNQYYWNYGM